MNFNKLDLSAKIRWRMRFEKSRTLIRFTDKLTVKQIASEYGVPFAKPLLKTKDPGDIPFSQLPANCFIKANHGCKWNILRRDGQFYHFGDGKKLTDEHGNFLDKNLKQFELSQNQAVALCRKWLKSRHSFREWAYRHVDPWIYAEEIIETRPGTEVMDYRFYNFNGDTAAINVGSPSLRKTGQNFFFDKEWNPISVKNQHNISITTVPPKPVQFDKMLKAAKQMGQNLDFVRVDFFVSGADYYLAELTVYPGGGSKNTPSSDQEFNSFLAGFWKFNHKQYFQALGWKYYETFTPRYRRRLKRKKAKKKNEHTIIRGD